ncbi:MAG: GGDEF domain-containing protein [Spirochaetaceae bacterium]|jgi:diguanylate cyclase (GGDEF)-like protein|nr:GGDEF domain-containing protein [Spirochaetaceae bacterium]
MSEAVRIPINDPALLKSPLFADLSQLEYNAVTAFLERTHIKKNAVLFSEGDRGGDMFILLSGSFRAFMSQSDGTRRWMFNISPGDFLGEMSIIADEPRSATLVAREDSDLMVLQGIDFYRIVFEHPMIGVKLLKAISSVQNMWLDQSSKHLNDLMRWGENARRRAITDELTGLYNRRFLEESIKDRFDHSSVGLRKLALMMMDLDHIHEINNRFGTGAGDKVILSAAEIIRSNLRPGDIAARLSGDEFAVLLPDTDKREARALAEDIRQGISENRVKVPNGKKSNELVALRIRTSIGIAIAPTHAKNREGLMIVADDALRKAKEMGRDRVELAG